jgi:hypothetical protein
MHGDRFEDGDQNIPTLHARQLVVTEVRRANLRAIGNATKRSVDLPPKAGPISRVVAFFRLCASAGDIIGIKPPVRGTRQALTPQQKNGRQNNIP